MFIMRRWWDRHGLQMVLVGLVLSTAWFLRQTQGAAISELYYLVARPFQSEPTPARFDRLTNAHVLELEQRLAELESQNQKLQKLLGYFQAQKQPVITAPIVGRSADSWWKQVTLGRGSQDGIEVGFVVTGIGGLVGRVVHVTPHTSRVLLISDPTSRVGATISRNRYMGFIQGQGSQIAVMQFFEKVPDVRPGDIVTTSSVSRLFPSGLPIGRVKSINLDKGPAPEAIIELTAPLGYLEWVIAHPFESK
ncbi:MAG: rod shape-determining protein MreC [Xenococcaceae cyanobacterium]